jgi:hypothetical protein
MLHEAGLRPRVLHAPYWETQQPEPFPHFPVAHHAGIVASRYDLALLHGTNLLPPGFAAINNCDC